MLLTYLVAHASTKRGLVASQVYASAWSTTSSAWRRESIDKRLVLMVRLETVTLVGPSIVHHFNTGLLEGIEVVACFKHVWLVAVLQTVLQLMLVIFLLKQTKLLCSQ